MKKQKRYKITVIEWQDSYGALSGWVEMDGYKPEPLVCISSGIKVFENKKVVALAPNYAGATTYTPRQANGLMVIPKSCINRITSLQVIDQLFEYDGVIMKDLDSCFLLNPEYQMSHEYY